MIYSKEVEMMCPVAKGAKHEPAPIPEEGKMGFTQKKSKIFQVLHMVLAGVLHSRVLVSLH